MKKHYFAAQHTHVRLQQAIRSLLNYHSPIRSLRSANTIFCRFHVSAQPLPPVVLALQTHSLELTTL